MTFAKNIVKTVTQNLRSKYSRKCIDYAKQSAIYALKATSKIVIQKMAEATGYLVGNENADNTVKTALQSATETPIKIDKKLTEISKEKYVSAKKNRTNYFQYLIKLRYNLIWNGVKYEWNVKKQ